MEIMLKRDPTFNEGVQEGEYKLWRILSAGWRIYFRQIKLIALISFIINLPVNMIDSALDSISIFEGKPLQAFLFSWLLYQVLTAVWRVLEIMAIAVIVEQTLAGKLVIWSQVVNKTFSKWVPAVLTALLAFLLINLWFTVFGIFGIIYSVYYLFDLYIVVLRNKQGKSALNYSKSLVEERWWQVCGIALVVISISLILSLIVFIPRLLFPDNMFIDIIYGTLYCISLDFTYVCLAVLFIRLDAIGPVPYKWASNP